MTKCEQCNKSFPDHLVERTLSWMPGDDSYEDLCPICALKKVNEIGGLPKDTPFQGKEAQSLWEEAKAFLEG